MSPSFFPRLSKLLVTSVVCSSPIYLTHLIEITDIGILVLSFVAFAVIIAIDAHHFSFEFWETENYYSYLLLPLLVYIVMGFLTCLFFQPYIFNRIFLPLRFAGSFGIRTIGSIAIVSVVFILIVTVSRFWGARSGRMFFDA